MRDPELVFHPYYLIVNCRKRFNIFVHKRMESGKKSATQIFAEASVSRLSENNPELASQIDAAARSPMPIQIRRITSESPRTFQAPTIGAPMIHVNVREGPLREFSDRLRSISVAREQAKSRSAKRAS